MAKIASLFFLACFVIFNASGFSAEEPAASEYGESHTALDNKESAVDIPVGMELRKIGYTSMIVPEGTQSRQKGNLFVVESPDEYAARNIFEMKGRLMALEVRQHSIEKELNDLREAMLKLQKKSETQ